jgi:methylase of polypeptide subunit release factors
MKNWQIDWSVFKENLPFTEFPYSKRNWGNGLHSLCSFYGKLKPAIAHHLIKTFTSENDTILDCFSGSGTIPFECALNNRRSFGIDINPMAITISKAKVLRQNKLVCQSIINELKEFINSAKIEDNILIKAQSFGFNKTLKEYYHIDTFQEILKARMFFANYPNQDANFYLVLSCLVHILHGNRPYALSRNSHPITPYAPTGEYIYKNLIEKLEDKVKKSLLCNKTDFTEGKIYEQDILSTWNEEIQNVDAIITSPPFFDSTRFYMTNWLRNWFLGWEKEDFDKQKISYIDEKQKKGLDIYQKIFFKTKERLKKDGVMALHLGKSNKKDMGKELAFYAKPYFNNIELFQEDVSKVENHGISDKGTVSTHQYLVLY